MNMMRNSLEFIKIVLVETTHPGNIGASARAMKTMGFSRLHLVKPKLFPNAEATARAAGADDILSYVQGHQSLSEAVNDCVLVIGTSARLRNLSCPVLPLDIVITDILECVRNESQVAIVFGRESSGLSNEELDICNKMILIPTSDDFSSLNLSSAVQIICYELFKFSKANDSANQKLIDMSETITNEELNKLYKHLQQCLIEIEFLDPEKPRKLMRRLKQLFNRSALDQNEYNILRGILSAVQEKVRQK